MGLLYPKTPNILLLLTTSSGNVGTIFLEPD